MSTRRRIVALLLAFAVVAAIVAGARYEIRHAHDGEAVFVRAGCPALLRSTSSALQDFADVLYWDGRLLVAAEREATPGPRLGAVTCSISQLENPNAWRVTSDPWPDGTAVILTEGTPLYAAEGAPAGAVVARTSAGDVLYCVADDQLGIAC